VFESVITHRVNAVTMPPKGINPYAAGALNKKITILIIPTIDTIIIPING
jgi:hypothetical protein